MELDAELETAVRRIAGQQKRSAEAIVADAVRQYVDRAAMWDGFVAEADASWDDYQATGLHLTGPELDAWLQSWGTRGTTAPPLCHD